MFWHFRNLVSNSLKKAKCDYYTGMILENKNKPNLMWKYLRELMSGNSKPSAKSLLVVSQIPRLFLMVTSPPLVLSQQIVSLQQLHSPHMPHQISKHYTSYCHFRIISKLLHDVPENKAVDLDRLPGELIHAAAPAISISLTFILNLSLQSGKFISEWKPAKVLPLFKSGLLMNTNNYRQISILPILSNQLEHYVHTCFSEYLETHNLLTIAQSGFRRLHSILVHLYSSVYFHD